MRKIVCYHLLKVCGDYPSKEQKIDLAKAIIIAFPVLAYDGDGEAYEAYYCTTRGTKGQPAGFIDQKLKEIRKPWPQERRKRKNEPQNEPENKKGKNKKPKGDLPTLNEDSFNDPEIEHKVL